MKFVTLVKRDQHYQTTIEIQGNYELFAIKDLHIFDFKNEFITNKVVMVKIH